MVRFAGSHLYDPDHSLSFVPETKCLHPLVFSPLYRWNQLWISKHIGPIARICCQVLLELCPVIENDGQNGLLKVLLQRWKVAWLQIKQQLRDQPSFSIAVCYLSAPIGVRDKYRIDRDVVFYCFFSKPYSTWLPQASVSSVSER